jgi:hypothetical protein
VNLLVVSQHLNRQQQRVIILAVKLCELLRLDALMAAVVPTLSVSRNANFRNALSVSVVMIDRDQRRRDRQHDGARLPMRQVLVVIVEAVYR